MTEEDFERLHGWSLALFWFLIFTIGWLAIIGFSFVLWNVVHWIRHAVG
jgi:hypothetical protein